MILCLDIGNSHIFGGVFAKNTKNLLLRFRHNTDHQSTSDQFGVFLKGVLRENNIPADQVSRVAISSVVPSVDYSLGSACIKYFNYEPFWLKSGVKTGLKLKVKHTNEVGADLIATAIAAADQFTNRNLIIIDLGTVNTFVALTKEKEFLGCVFYPGLRTSMQALESATEKLPTVQIIRPSQIIGRDSISSIQSGLYFAQLGAFKEIIGRISAETFPDDPPLVIGTGGFAHLFKDENLFTEINPDLILQGIRLALLMNSNLPPGSYNE